MNPEHIPTYALVGVITYLIGSVPAALLATAILKRSDLRNTGSGNLGIQNTFFRAGKLPAIIALLWNVAAAASSVLLARALAPNEPVVELIAITAVTTGSMWQVFVRFRGSRGTTTMGFGLLVAQPAIWAVCLGIWLLALLPRRRTTDATPTVHALLPAVFGLYALFGQPDLWWIYAIWGAVLGGLLELKRRTSPDDAMALGLYRRFGVNVHE